MSKALSSGGVLNFRVLDRERGVFRESRVRWFDRLSRCFEDFERVRERFLHFFFDADLCLEGRMLCAR
jgi:hypothetical protein